MLGEKGQRIRELTSVVQKRYVVYLRSQKKPVTNIVETLISTSVSKISLIVKHLAERLIDLTSRKAPSKFSLSVSQTVDFAHRRKLNPSNISFLVDSQSVALVTVSGTSQEHSAVS